jgi:hypothetical protein
MPAPVHKPFDDLADLERVFDTKQTSRTAKSKIVFGEKKKGKAEEEKKPNTLIFTYI